MAGEDGAAWGVSSGGEAHDALGVKRHESGGALAAPPVAGVASGVDSSLGGARAEESGEGSAQPTAPAAAPAASGAGAPFALLFPGGCPGGVGFLWGRYERK